MNPIQVPPDDFMFAFCLFVFLLITPGVGLMVRVVGLGSEGPEYKSRSAVELIPGGVNCLSSF